MHTPQQTKNSLVHALGLTSNVPLHSEAGPLRRPPGLGEGEDVGQARAEEDHLAQVKRTATPFVAGGP